MRRSIGSRSVQTTARVASDDSYSAGKIADDGNERTLIGRKDRFTGSIDRSAAHRLGWVCRCAIFAIATVNANPPSVFISAG